MVGLLSLEPSFLLEVLLFDDVVAFRRFRSCLSLQDGFETVRQLQ